MIKVENIDVWGFEHAIRGARNPLNSWYKSDSYQSDFTDDDKHGFVIGPNDMDLMRRLYKAGPEHRKYLRQIFVSMDITAPLYWWKEKDQYRINVTTNSCSTMHKIAAKEFELDDFSHEHLLTENAITFHYVKDDFRVINNAQWLMYTCDLLNAMRDAYLETNDKTFWWQMIQLLPSSYNQRRTVTMNYENVMSMINQRTGHKLDEWNTFVDILKSLPYIKEIRGESDG